MDAYSSDWSEAGERRGEKIMWIEYLFSKEERSLTDAKD